MDVSVAADLSFMREVNTTAILQILHSSDRVSVAEIASAAGLSRQAVSRSLHDLHDAGLVEMLPPERSEGRSGRPAQLVRFRGEAGYVLSAFIDPAQARVAVADLTGRIVHASVVALGGTTDGADAVDALVAQVRDAVGEAGLTPAEVIAATVGVPGIVDPETGVVHLVASMPGLNGDIVVRALTDCLACTVYVDNDVKLATLGEQWRGVQRDEKSLVVVHWGERIGAGILLDGSLYRGANNDAGDLGFLDLIADAQDQQTAHPELGRFEEWAGASALIHLTATELAAAGDASGNRALHDAGDGALDLIMAGLTRGEQPYLTALDTIAQRFGAGLVAIRALLDPQVVVLTGPVAKAGAPLLDALYGAFADYSLKLPELHLSALGDEAVVHGGIRHALDELERTRYAPIKRRRATSTAG